MNFYLHHMGDFNSATRHLTRVERSLYRDLIELYYDTESPLTDDIQKLNRKVIARTEEEIQAVYDVLDEFFYLVGGVYRHIRCDEEIAKYHANSTAKANAGRASAEARRKKKEALINESEQVFNTRSTEREQNPTNQEPITKNQEPITNLKTLDQTPFDHVEEDGFFEAFWNCGIRKVNKKKTKPLFIRLMRSSSQPNLFAALLITDVQQRTISNQLGFAEMHPTTYLNGERWKDEIKQSTAPPEERKTTFENLTDTSWADGLVHDPYLAPHDNEILEHVN